MGEYRGSLLLVNDLNEFTMDGEKETLIISSLFTSDNLA